MSNAGLWFRVNLDFHDDPQCFCHKADLTEVKCTTELKHKASEFSTDKYNPTTTKELHLEPTSIMT